MMEQTFTMSIESTVSDEDRTAVERGLMDHAAGMGIEPDAPQQVAVLLRDQSGALVGGLIGQAMWGWLNIRLLWVSETFRSKGHGGRLLRAGEDEGARRGCHHARLEVFSPDALRFYLREGYATYGILADYPKGHTRHCLAKPIYSK